jgi:hypothetical protein
VQAAAGRILAATDRALDPASSDRGDADGIRPQYRLTGATVNGAPPARGRDPVPRRRGVPLDLHSG